jgi:hypothetical protein
MHQALAASVYDGGSGTELSWPAWGAGLGVFMLCILMSRRNRRGRRVLEDGQKLRVRADRVSSEQISATISRKPAICQVRRLQMQFEPSTVKAR